eukprot:COSAG01_NODE_10145_length_2237_cov_2.528064_1_plen_39_part_10
MPPPPPPPPPPPDCGGGCGGAQRGMVAKVVGLPGFMFRR